MPTGLSFRQEDGKVSLCVFCGPSLSDTVPLKCITGGAHSLSAVGLVRFRNQKGVELVVSRATLHALPLLLEPLWWIYVPVAE